MTQAPVWAGERERYYRRQFTESLTRWIAMRGLSYYILSDVGGDSPFVTPAETLDRLDAATRDVAASLWRKQLPPVAFVGLAEGAVVAARAAARAPFPTELAALAPSLPDRAGKQPPAWDDVTQGLLNHVPGLLAIQSACDGPMPAALVRAADFRHRLVIVPNVDSWLGLMRDGACTGDRLTPGLVPGLSVVRMVAEWLGGTVIFPE